jgi:N-acetyl-gamma-glutamyl-phosphate reductase
VHPNLAAAYPAATVEAFGSSDLDNVDLVFAALPHGESQKIAGEVLDRGLRLVDLGADFRLADPAAYQQWYGEEHEAPGLLPAFVYGIPELHRDRIRGVQAVAAAGCYPTAAILALKPLVDAGLIRTTELIVDAASGVSGAGRAVKEATAFNTVSGSFSAYGLLNHRHTAEMEQELGARVLFTPHLAPMARGILATCYAEATADMDPNAPLEALRRAYAAEPFVHAMDQPPATKWVSGSNSALVTARYDPRTGRVLALGAIDNLVKGAAGQMIQCANLMLGLDETAGLGRCGVYP